RERFRETKPPTPARPQPADPPSGTASSGPCRPSSGPRRPELEGGPVTAEGVLSVLAGGPPRSFFFSRDHLPISAYFRPLPAGTRIISEDKSDPEPRAWDAD